MEEASQFEAQRMQRNLLPFAFDVSSLTLLKLHAKVRVKAVRRDSTTPCGIHENCSRPSSPPPFTLSFQSETRLRSNPDVSNRNVKKTKLSLSRSPTVCYLSLGDRVIIQLYAAALGEPHIFWGLAVK